MKDPKKVAAGKAGAVVRWGVPRSVRLDGLTHSQRALVVAIVVMLEEVNGVPQTEDLELKRRIAERAAEREASRGR